MSPQIACPRGCILTLVAFVWLFYTVYFQMCPQSAWIIACIFALVAFVWLFSVVHFKMLLQIACMIGCIITLVAIVRFFCTLTILSLKFFCKELSCSRFCSITTKRQGLSSVAVRFKLWKFRYRIEKKKKMDLYKRYVIVHYVLGNVWKGTKLSIIRGR